MKKITVSIALFLFVNILFAQVAGTNFQSGWYIIQKDAQYGVILPSYLDASGETGKPQEIDRENLSMNVGEVVLAYDQKAGITYCFDPLGRMLAFKSGLKKAPVSAISNVGIVFKDIELIDGNDIKTGSYVWIIGQDVAKNTITIQLVNDKTLEIPKDNIELITKVVRSFAKEDIMYKVAQ